MKWKPDVPLHFYSFDIFCCCYLAFSFLLIFLQLLSHFPSIGWNWMMKNRSVAERLKWRHIELNWTSQSHIYLSQRFIWYTIHIHAWCQVYIGTVLYTDTDRYVTYIHSVSNSFELRVLVFHCSSSPTLFPIGNVDYGLHMTFSILFMDWILDSEDLYVYMQHTSTSTMQHA